MDKPTVASKTPAVFEIEPGEYWWCSCGLSKNQPYCDGSHKGSQFRPEKLVITEKKRVALCTCKQTGNSPFCDGTHAKL